MNTTPTPEALRHRAAARRWARGGMWGFTVASSLTNVTVIAGSDNPTILRLALGGLAPFVLAGMTHLLAEFTQGELTVSGIPAWLNWVTAAAVTAIGGGAFWLSFETLRKAAEPDHGERAWVFPATLDLAIVVCTVAMVVIARADEADQRAGVPPRVTVWSRFAARISDRLSGQGVRGASAPVARHDAVDQPVHEPVHELVYPGTLARLTAPAARHDAEREPDHDSASQSATCDDATTRPGGTQLDDAVGDADAADHGAGDVPADDAVTQPLARIDDATQDAPDATADDATPRTADPDRDALPTRRLASVPAASADDDDAELILRLIEQGASGTDVAAELGVSKSTALRRMKAVRKAADLAEASA